MAILTKEKKPAEIAGQGATIPHDKAGQLHGGGESTSKNW